LENSLEKVWNIGVLALNYSTHTWPKRLGESRFGSRAAISSMISVEPIPLAADADFVIVEGAEA
jgi:hypothetical protein